ncbi:MAG: replication initiation factor [Bacillota bacterium]
MSRLAKVRKIGAQQTYNMLGANYIQEGVKALLIRGIDTLIFGLDIENYKGELGYILKKFDALKEEAQKTGKEIIIELNGVTLTVEPSGMPFYRYRLTCNDWIIGFSEKPVNINPDIKVRLISGFLWSYGYQGAYEKFLDWFDFFGVKILKSKITRLDICADTDKVRFVESDREGFVTRAKSHCRHHVTEEHFEGSTFTGFSIGSGKPLLVRIYDKSKEIRKSGKEWFKDIWKDKGWDGEKTVWRVEFQLKREVLKELGISSVEDVWGKEDALWSYLTTKWLQLKKGSGKNVSRLPDKSKWKVIQKAEIIKEVSPLVREKVLEGDLKRLLDQGGGILLSIGALTKSNCIEEALEKLKAWQEGKLIAEGANFRGKVELRRTKFIR